MKPLAECLLYTFVDTAYLHGRSVNLVAQQLCDGGTDLIQLRAKHSSKAEIRRMAEAIHPITERAGVTLVINDHPQIAIDVGTPVCHLGQEDFFESGYHRVAGLVRPAERLMIGLSTHAPDQAQRAIHAGAAYLAVGPVYPTLTKPSVKPVTLEFVRWASTNVGIPWFAIGGINLGNLDTVLEAGARRICAVSAILNAPSVTEACQKLKERLQSAQL